MKISDLHSQNIVIWGTGREAMAVAKFLRRHFPAIALTFVDEKPVEASSLPFKEEQDRLFVGPQAMIEPLEQASILIKSPGVSLYHPLVQRMRERGVIVTSLLNLWFKEPKQARIICITGTKGKSTTATLITHMLNGMGYKAALLGNIGIPVGEPLSPEITHLVVELSSYQAADFEGWCDVAILTLLAPEHLDWHGSLEQYYRDKLHLLGQARVTIIDRKLAAIVRRFAPSTFNGRFIDTESDIADKLHNPYLVRPHNCANVVLALTALDEIGIDRIAALSTLKTFRGLPHRQEELGVKGDRLYVDDSISTTPQSSIAAMKAYQDRPITLIVGGHDRLIDYGPLCDYIALHHLHFIICMGVSGKRIASALRGVMRERFAYVTTMEEAVALAEKKSPAHSVILLSPAAPSYDLFKDFAERGNAFAKCAGFR